MTWDIRQLVTTQRVGKSNMSVYIKTKNNKKAQKVMDMIKTSRIFDDDIINYKTKGLIVYKSYNPDTTMMTPDYLGTKNIIKPKDVKKFMKNGVFQNKEFLEEFDK